MEDPDIGRDAPPPESGRCRGLEEGIAGGQLHGRRHAVRRAEEAQSLSAEHEEVHQAGSAGGGSGRRGQRTDDGTDPHPGQEPAIALRSRAEDVARQGRGQGVDGKPTAEVKATATRTRRTEGAFQPNRIPVDICSRMESRSPEGRAGFTRIVKREIRTAR